ncbi:MAG TPA: hypothetical protein VEB21_01490 [Terriglobales bacterium]|nr:hypothetical protein [Terriglobales bacterium]
MASVRQWSPSFVVAITLLVAGAAGVVVWQLWRPNDVAASEQVVRELAAGIAKQVGPFRRQLRRITNAPAISPDESAQAVRKVDELAADAIDRIEQLEEEASAQIEAMSGISLKTQDNRLGRIEDRVREGIGAIKTAADEAKMSLGAPSDQIGTEREEP